MSEVVTIQASIDFEKVIELFNRRADELVAACNKHLLPLGITSVDITGITPDHIILCFEYYNGWHSIVGDLVKLRERVELFGTPDYSNVDPDGLWSSADE